MRQNPFHAEFRLVPCMQTAKYPSRCQLQVRHDLAPSWAAVTTLETADSGNAALMQARSTESASVRGCPECAWGKVAGCWRCGSRIADVQAEAIALARRVGWVDAAFDTAHKYGLSAADARAIGQAAKTAIEEEASAAFRACVARGGMRHVGNSGRV